MTHGSYEISLWTLRRIFRRKNWYPWNFFYRVFHPQKPKDLEIARGQNLFFRCSFFQSECVLKEVGQRYSRGSFFQTVANWLVLNFSPEIIGRFLLKCHCMFANRILSENWNRLPSCKLKYQAISITVLIRCWGVSPDSSEIEGHKQKTKIKYLGQRENIIFKMVQNFC